MKNLLYLFPAPYLFAAIITLFSITAEASDTAKEASDTAKEASDKAKEASDKAKEANDKAKEANDKAKEAGDKAKEAGDKAKEAGDKAKEAGDKAKEAGDKAKEVGDKATAGDNATAGTPTIKVTTSYSESMLGDHMELVANLDGFKETVIDKKTGIEKTMTKCAPLGAKFAINNIDPTKQVIDLNFLDVEQKRIHWYNNLFSRQDTVEKEKRALAACEAANRVNDYTSYQIENTKLASAAVKRTGIAFGMLVVPFKFRLGNAKDLVSSSTVAPYVGFRTSWAQSFGLRFTPIVSAGLGMVPVADASGKGTSTKAAFSTAAGLLLTSNKSEQFSVGALIGRDFLGRTDREADSAVSKLWVSFYIGLAF